MNLSVTTNSQSLKDLLTSSELQNVKSLSKHEKINVILQNESGSSAYVEGHGISASTTSSYELKTGTETQLNISKDDISNITLIAGSNITITALFFE